MGDQHSDTKPGAKGPVKEGGNNILVTDVLLALFEPFRQTFHDILVVLHQSFKN